MTSQIEVLVPNIGEATGVDVIEVHISSGMSIEKGDPLITLESDKASMEIPSEHSGKVAEVKLNVGDKVSEGSVILCLEAEQHSVEAVVETPVPEQEEAEAVAMQTASTAESTSDSVTIQQVVIPDIGGATDVDVIELFVNVGDSLEKEQAIATLEGDKATMDIPSPFKGKVQSISMKVGDKVSQGDLILELEVVAAKPSAKVIDTPVAQSSSKAKPQPAPAVTKQQAQSNVEPSSSSSTSSSSTTKVYASPSIRRLAREFGVDLSLVKGTGRKGRIVKQDVQSFVKKRLAEPVSAGGGIPKIPAIDFSKFGPVETAALNKIKRLTAQNMQRAWLNVPHVTQFDEADITELEAFRKANKEKALAEGAKLTPLAFIVQAVVKALKAFPRFNASLDETGENLIIKHYYNVGIAVDTPNGLVVPVIKDADKKGLLDLARDMADLSVKARKKALLPADMSGGCFTISSLGGIGGTAFTPIVNAPEVAILGVSKSQIKPIFNGSEFEPRLMLPLSLSYDHRVIDGAEAARFSTYLCQCLSDIRTLLL